MTALLNQVKRHHTGRLSFIKSSVWRRPVAKSKCHQFEEHVTRWTVSSEMSAICWRERSSLTHLCVWLLSVNSSFFPPFPKATAVNIYMPCLAAVWDGEHQLWFWLFASWLSLSSLAGRVACESVVYLCGAYSLTSSFTFGFTSFFGEPPFLPLIYFFFTAFYRRKYWFTFLGNKHRGLQWRWWCFTLISRNSILESSSSETWHRITIQMYLTLQIHFAFYLHNLWWW